MGITFIILLMTGVAGGSHSELVNKSIQPGSDARRLLLQGGTECVLYRKTTMFEDDHAEESWSCEFTPKQTKSYEGGGEFMIDITGISKEDIDAKGAVSGGTLLRTGKSAFVETNEGTSALLVPKDSGFQIEHMDWLVDHRHSRHRQLLRHRRHNRAPSDPKTYEVLVLRVIDSVGTSLDADALQLRESILEGEASLNSHLAGCSKDHVAIQATTKYFTMVNGQKVNGIVDVHIDIEANNSNSGKLERHASKNAKELYGKLGKEYDLVMFCQPPTEKQNWIAYAYVDHWGSYYNGKWCQRLSVQSHEIGHSLNLGHSGLADNEYGDLSCTMGPGYDIVGGPRQCYNAAKAYQLGWYSESVQSVDPLDFVEKPENFTLIGVASYEPNGSNRDKLVSLRLEALGDKAGIDYYIGYNHAIGHNNETIASTNLVTLFEKDNDYVVYQGRDHGYGRSRRLAALQSGKSYKIEKFGETNHDVEIAVTAINGTDASIQISTIVIPTPSPTHAPTKDPNCSDNRSEKFGKNGKTTCRKMKRKKKTIKKNCNRKAYPENPVDETKIYDICKGTCGRKGLGPGSDCNFDRSI